MDQLPVLQHCLLRMWNNALNRMGAKPHLDQSDYEAVGRMTGALSQHADEIMGELPGLESTVEQVFRALSERDKEGRATRRSIAFRQLIQETGRPEEEVRKVLDRFRDDDCLFLLPSKSSVPVLRDDARIDVVHEALLRGWEKISATTYKLPDGSVRSGWLAEEQRDGELYRLMLALTGAA